MLSRVLRACAALALALALTFHPLPPRPTLEGRPAKPAVVQPHLDCGETTTCP